MAEGKANDPVETPLDEMFLDFPAQQSAHISEKSMGFRLQNSKPQSRDGKQLGFEVPCIKCQKLDLTEIIGGELRISPE